MPNNDHAPYFKPRLDNTPSSIVGEAPSGTLPFTAEQIGGEEPWVFAIYELHSKVGLNAQVAENYSAQHPFVVTRTKLVPGQSRVNKKDHQSLIIRIWVGWTSTTGEKTCVLMDNSQVAAKCITFVAKRTKTRTYLLVIRQTLPMQFFMSNGPAKSKLVLVKSLDRDVPSGGNGAIICWPVFFR